MAIFWLLWLKACSNLLQDIYFAGSKTLTTSLEWANLRVATKPKSNGEGIGCNSWPIELYYARCWAKAQAQTCTKQNGLIQTYGSQELHGPCLRRTRSMFVKMFSCFRFEWTRELLGQCWICKSLDQIFLLRFELMAIHIGQAVEQNEFIKFKIYTLFAIFIDIY